MKVCVTIATYNEKDNIIELINQILNLGIERIQIVVVDDNSPDGTSDLVKRMMNENKRIHLITRSGKLGYGSAHMTGFKYALCLNADVIISMDADFSHEPRVIRDFINEINNGYDVVVGSRRVKGGRVVDWNLWRKVCSKGAMLISKIILGIRVADLTSGYRAYRREVFQQIDLDSIQSDGYSFLEELIYLVENNNFKIKEVPIIFYDRRLGDSKLSKKEIYKFFLTIFKLKFKKRKSDV